MLIIDRFLRRLGFTKLHVSSTLTRKAYAIEIMTSHLNLPNDDFNEFHSNDSTGSVSCTVLSAAILWRDLLTVRSKCGLGNVIAASRNLPDQNGVSRLQLRPGYCAAIASSARHFEMSTGRSFQKLNSTCLSLCFWKEFWLLPPVFYVFPWHYWRS